MLNNTKTKIDVDKFDYLLRDPNHIGLDYSFHYGRIFNKSHIINNNIVYDESIASNILDLFTTRYRFHKDIYNHTTVKLIELMLGDALVGVKDIYDFDNIIHNENFITLDDSIYSQILFSSDVEFNNSKNMQQQQQHENQSRELVHCFQTRTNETTHQLIRENLHLLPNYDTNEGDGVGPSNATN